MNRTTLIAGVGGGLLASLLLAPATGTALGELARARGERSAAAAIISAPVETPPLVPSAQRVPGGSEREAGRIVIGRLHSLAAANGVLVEQAEALRGGDGLVRVRLRLSGPDKAVVALADRIERERPLVRFGGWQVDALADGGLRLEGEAVAAWR